MSAITPHYRNVQQLLQSQSFSIDEYQREYKWERKNTDELLSDLPFKFCCYNRFNEGAVDEEVMPSMCRMANDQSIQTPSIHA